MVAGKTAALLRCAACLGPILSGASDSTVSAMWEFGHHLGIAFQAVDDVLGIWGKPDVTGKPVGSDLRSFKKTLPVCIATSMGVEVWPPSMQRVADAVTDEDVAEMRRQLEACGARRATNDLTQRHLDDALVALQRVPLEPTAREQLASLAHYVVDRDR
jgi:geranylgeranyl diphosphate synthase type I